MWLFEEIMDICVVGAGYVGLSLAVMLSVNHKVKLVEINKTKLDLLYKKNHQLKMNTLNHIYLQKILS